MLRSLASVRQKKMTNSLTSSLIQAIQTRSYLPVVGWGYPDLVPISTETLKSDQQRHDFETDTLQWLKIASPSLSPLYQAVGSLPVPCIIALTPDPFMENTLRYYDPNLITLQPNQADYPPDRRILLPLGGFCHNPGTMLLSESDYLNLPKKQEILWDLAQSYASRTPLLVLGCNIADSLLRHILSKLRLVPLHKDAGWFLCQNATEKDCIAWHALGFEVIEAPMANLLRDIVRIANQSTSSTDCKPRRLFKLKTPYKYLDYFERDESELFFGRESESKKLVDLACGHRLVILTGTSGVGKTSLINAGLLAWADNSESHGGIYARCDNDPVKAIRQATIKSLQLGKDFERDRESLTAFLVRVRDETGLVPLIVLDQAEEMFTRLGEALRNELLEVLRECLTAIPIVARFVISLREDYLARLAELRSCIPNLLQNVFYLEELTHEGALAAIQKPAKVVDVDFDKTLAETILREIGRGTVAPPQIQIVCSRLFEARDGKNIDKQLYQKLGGAENILRGYLTDALQSLGDDATDTKRVFKAMVTSEGTKDVLNSREVAKRADISEKRAFYLLLHLRDETRLLRSVQQEREVRFELAHEYLTKEIWTWMTEDDLNRRAVEELMAKELRSWNRFTHLRLGLDRLQLFEKHGDLLEADEEALVLLLLSTVKHQRPAQKWVERVANLGLEAQDYVASKLFDYFQDKDYILRREAAETIAELEPAPIVRALSSNIVSKRKAALEIIGGLEIHSAVEAVAVLVEDEDEEVRILACGALGEIGGDLAVRSLLKAASGKESKVTEAAIAALGRAYTPESYEAYSVIKNALNLNDSIFNKAAQRAIEFSQNFALIQTLLKDQSVKEEARKGVWDVIERSPIKYSSWIFELVTEISEEEEQKKAIKLCDNYISVSSLQLDILAQSKGVLGKWANDKLEANKKDTEARAVANNKVSQEFSLDKVEELLENSELKTTIAAVEELANLANKGKQDAIDLIIKLLQHDTGRVRAGAVTTIYYMRTIPKEFDKFLPHLFKDKDSTVRYYACIVAVKHKRSELADQIRYLIEDNDKFRYWYQPEIGELVKDAAIYALEKLRPNSKVWRKPFQQSFYEKSD